MTPRPQPPNKKSLSVFTLTIFVSLYWLAGQLVDVYRFPVLGGIYELLWIGMVIALLGLPVLSFIFLVKNKFSPRSLYFYSFIISIVSIVVLVTVFSRQN